jgi:hypothetical protein
MIRKAAALSSLLLAACAVFASSAMALELHSETSPVKIEGAQTTTLQLKVESGVAKCTTATFVGESAKTPTTETTFTASYSGCKIAGITETTECINCKYRTTWFGLTTDWEAEIHRIRREGCTITLPKQSMSGIKFSNTGTGTGRKIVETIEATGLAYTEEGGACASPGSHTNGTFSGSITYGGVGQGIWVE